MEYVVDPEQGETTNKNIDLSKILKDNEIEKEDDEEQLTDEPNDLKKHHNEIHEKIQSTEIFPTTSSLSELDIWLKSVKLALVSLSKINQAKARRDINTIISNYEIEQLQNESGS